MRDEIKQFQIDWNKRGCVPVLAEDGIAGPHTVRAFLTRIEELRQAVRLAEKQRRDLIEPIEVDI